MFMSVGVVTENVYIERGDVDIFSQSEKGDNESRLAAAARPRRQRRCERVRRLRHVQGVSRRG
jgi:hypothetical protein